MEIIMQSIAEHYETFDWVLAFWVGVTYFIADALYAQYTIYVAENRAVRAATTGAFLHFVLALGVLSYVGNYLYIVPIAIGSWFGTYVLVYRNARNKIKQNILL